MKDRFVLSPRSPLWWQRWLVRLYFAGLGVLMIWLLVRLPSMTTSESVDEIRVPLVVPAWRVLSPPRKRPKRKRIRRRIPKQYQTRPNFFQRPLPPLPRRIERASLPRTQRQNSRNTSVTFLRTGRVRHVLRNSKRNKIRRGSLRMGQGVTRRSSTSPQGSSRLLRSLRRLIGYQKSRLRRLAIAQGSRHCWQRWCIARRARGWHLFFVGGRWHGLVLFIETGDKPAVYVHHRGGHASLSSTQIFHLTYQALRSLQSTP